MMTMFDTIYINKNAEGAVGIVPVSSHTLNFANRNYPKIKCKGMHEVPSFPSHNKIITIGEFILAIVVYPDRLGMTLDNAFLRIDAAPYILVKTIDNGSNTAVIVYEARNSTEHWLGWVYVMLESKSAYKFKSRAPEGRIISSLTPDGFIIVTDQRAYRFEREAQGMSLNVIKYNGPELSVLMFYEGSVGVAIAQSQNHTFLHTVGYNLTQIGPSYEVSKLGNYSIERTSTYMPVISSLNTDNQLLTIYPNMEDFNEQILVTSILPNTHNVSVDVYRNEYISILEFAANYTRRTTINEEIKRIEEPKFLHEGRVLAQGTYKQAPGPSFIPTKIYEDIEQLEISKYTEQLEELHHLEELLQNFDPARDNLHMLRIFFAGRVAHYIAPSISPQLYFTKTARGKVVVSTSLAKRHPIACTLKQHTEVFAAAFILGSPVDVTDIRCYNNEATGESMVDYRFGSYMFMLTDMYRDTSLNGWIRALERQEEYLKKNVPDGDWVFPEIDMCKTSIRCDQEHFINSIRKLFPNATKVFEDVLRPAACTYNNAEWRPDHTDISEIGVAQNIQERLLLHLHTIDNMLKDVSENNVMGASTSEL